MNSMVNQMTSWLGGIAGGKPDSDNEEEGEATSGATAAPPTKTPETEDEKKDEEKPTTPPKEGAATEADGDETESKKAEAGAMDIDLEEVSTKAISAAKEWGTYLFSVGKTATQQMTEQVSKTAKVIKTTVEEFEEKTIIGDFKREQTKFVTENKEKKKQSEAAVPPWVGYNEEEAMKNQILALSADKRNLLRNPPAGVQFNFDFESSFPVATAMLQEDPTLHKLRFELVPKQINEETFWRNYFYRVSLIKQSAQLTSIAQQTGTTGETSSRPSSGKGDSSPKDSSTEAADKPGQGGQAESKSPEPEELPPSSPTDHEFVSDSFVANEISEEDLKKEMQQLGMSDKEEDIPEWERELQAELQEYEVVDDADDADLEQEIMQQLEEESKES